MSRMGMSTVSLLLFFGVPFWRNRVGIVEDLWICGKTQGGGAFPSYPDSVNGC